MPETSLMFLNLKKRLAGTRVSGEQEFFIAVQGSLSALSENGLLHVFEKWSERCNKWIVKQSSYIEKKLNNKCH